MAMEMGVTVRKVKRMPRNMTKTNGHTWGHVVAH